MKSEDWLNGRKRRPTHPGELLREEVLPEAKMSQTELADALGVPRKTINEIVREKAAVTADMALRLARDFNTTPDMWLGLQRDADLWEAMTAHTAGYVDIKPLQI